MFRFVEIDLLWRELQETIRVFTEFWVA